VTDKKIIYPKEFIKDVLIQEYGEIVPKHPYLAYALICSGIEMLGKCLNKSHTWESKSNDFIKCINKLFPEKYHRIEKELKDELRNGLLHSLRPKSKIKLDELRKTNIFKNNHPHIYDNEITLVIEYFYIDFVEACKKVIEKDFPKESKMHKPFINIT